MGLDLWFREDVVRILVATHETMRASMAGAALSEPVGTNPVESDAYRKGFTDALRSVAVAFGVALPSIGEPLGEPRWLTRRRDGGGV